MALFIRQEINILSGEIVSATTVTTVRGKSTVQLDLTQYVNPTVYYEVIAKNTDPSNHGEPGVSAITDNFDYSIDIPANTTNYTRFRSPAITITTQVQNFVANASMLSGTTGTVSVKAARLIIIDNPTILTSTETQIEIGNNQTGLTSTTAGTALASPKYWLYTAANWDGTLSFFAEVTYACSSSKSTMTIVLQEDNGSFASWTTKTTIVSGGTATTATRVRVPFGFTPTDGRHYRLAYNVASSKSAGSIFNGKIIVDQSTSMGVDDSYSETNFNNNYGIANSAFTFLSIGQSFQSSGGYIRIAKFYLIKGGSPTGNMYAKLYTHSGVYGTSSIPTGAALAISDPIDVSTLSSSNALITFTFSGSNQYKMATSTDYVIAVEYTGGDGSNFVGAGTNNSTPTDDGNFSSLTGTTWSANNGIDACFYVYTTTTIITLLETQYLLLNTTSSSSLGLQSAPTLWDSTEWSGVTNTYLALQDGNSSSINETKLIDIDNSNALVPNSDIVGGNQIIGSALTMPTTGHQIDVNVVVGVQVIYSSRILVLVRVSSSTPISVSDSGSGTDSISILVTVPLSDSGSGSDAKSIIASMTVSDSGTGSDTALGANIISVSDSGSGSDAVSLLPLIILSDSASSIDVVSLLGNIALSDSGSGIDSISILDKLSLSENGSGSDAIAVIPTISVADSGSGVDSTSIATSISVTDSGSGIETLAILVALALSDSGSGVDIQSILSRISLSDNVTGSDAVTLLGMIALNDSGNAVDTLSTLPSVALSDSGNGIDAVLVAALTTAISLSDSGVGSDAVNTLFEIAVSDSATGADALSVLAKIAQSDSGSATEALGLLVQLSLQENGIGVDAQSILAEISLNDSGLASDIESILQFVTTSDSGVGNDNTTVTSSVSINDSGAGNEQISLSTFITLNEVGSAIDTLGIFVSLVLKDIGKGIDGVALFKSTRGIFVSTGQLATQISGRGYTYIKQQFTRLAGGIFVKNPD